MAALPLALMTSVQAQSSLAEIQRAGVIKIGTEGAYPPFTYHDKSGKLVGFDVEIGELIASGLGVKPEFVEGGTVPSPGWTPSATTWCSTKWPSPLSG